MGQHFRGALRAAIAILLLSVLLCSEALATSIPCYINTDTKVYNTPSTSAKLSLKVSEDLSVTMTGLSGSWAQVTREGVTAYIPVKYLTLKNRIKKAIRPRALRCTSPPVLLRRSWERCRPALPFTSSAATETISASRTRKVPSPDM